MVDEDCEECPVFNVFDNRVTTVKKLVLQDQHIAVELSREAVITGGSIKLIYYGHLNMDKVFARWISGLLISQQKKTGLGLQNFPSNGIK